MNKVHHELGPICLASLHMDSFELWMIGNSLSQSITKCYYLINTLWHFVVNACHHICISPHPTCIFNSCIALNEILHFIKGQLCSISERYRLSPLPPYPKTPFNILFQTLLKDTEVEVRLVPISCIQALCIPVIILSGNRFHNFFFYQSSIILYHQAHQ